MASASHVTTAGCLTYSVIEVCDIRGWSAVGLSVSIPAAHAAANGGTAVGSSLAAGALTLSSLHGGILVAISSVGPGTSTLTYVYWWVSRVGDVLGWLVMMMAAGWLRFGLGVSADRVYDMPLLRVFCGCSFCPSCSCIVGFCCVGDVLWLV